MSSIFELISRISDANPWLPILISVIALIISIWTAIKSYMQAQEFKRVDLSLQYSSELAEFSVAVCKLERLNTELRGMKQELQNALPSRMIPVDQIDHWITRSQNVLDGAGGHLKDELGKKKLSFSDLEESTKLMRIGRSSCITASSELELAIEKWRPLFLNIPKTL
ncbi:MAG: hypothetical protein AAGL17_17790 [Cyanobacteria bacterium J06576_12]